MAELLRHNLRNEGRLNGMVRRPTLEEALEARKEFLNDYPFMRAYQAEIDRTLENTVGFENRVAVIGMMMESKIYQLRDSIAQLRATAVKINRILEIEKREDQMD